MGIGVLAIPKGGKTADGERIAVLIGNCMGSTGLLSELQKWARSRAPLPSTADSLILGKKFPQVANTVGDRNEERRQLVSS